MDAPQNKTPDSSRAPVPPASGGAGAEGESARGERGPSLLDPFERMFGSFRRIVSDYALLAVLDVRRAANQLAWLVGAGILVAVLLVSAWLAAVVALSVWLLGHGLSWAAVLGIAALVNLVAAGFVVWFMKDIFEQAPFSATLRQIRGDPAEGEDGAGKTGVDGGRTT